MLFSLFVLFSFAGIFISGINTDTAFISIIISFFSSCLGLIYLLKGGNKIRFPRHFLLLLIFVLILNIYLPFVQDKLAHFLFAAEMAVALIYWIVFYNLKNGDRTLKHFLIYSTIIYSAFYLLSKVFNINLYILAKLFFRDGLTFGHYHIGDLWAFAIVALVGARWNKLKLQNWIIAGMGCIYIYISNTRSAILSLAIGVGYLFVKQVESPKLKNIFITFLFILTAGFFIFLSLGKTTLFDRPYFLQSIESFAKYPLGVGMGNFKQIAEEYHLKNPTDGSLSIYTHNIFLESFSGVGVFSIFFLLFLIYLIRDVLNTNSKGVIWGAFIMAVISNFMFDTSYSVPGLIWILFMSIGVFQAEDLSIKN
jgi:hypothetical protein